VRREDTSLLYLTDAVQKALSILAANTSRRAEAGAVSLFERLPRLPMRALEPMQLRDQQRLRGAMAIVVRESIHAHRGGGQGLYRVSFTSAGR